jgi:hypothetical protein
MAGDLQPERSGNGGDAQPLGDAATSGDVGVQAVDGAGRAHSSEGVEVVPVFARGDVCVDGVA